MRFSEHQLRLWKTMLKSIEDFRKGNLQYLDLVDRLEGALYAGEFKDEELVKRWYDYWTPLEILNATKGNCTTIEDASGYLLDMEVFLKGICQASANL
ncbi:hypothetical protein [Pedobacter sp. ASV12]|uniref:hypothetical protein n=1 Tax=Pedobacter sp. ASV12 TaxID=2795120 RepID=UPI0018EC957C|nr:hypothetical protein [Pedobacter sp. ASV12]